MRKQLIALSVLALVGGSVIAAEDAATQPSDQSAPEHHHSARIPSPFNQLASLTDDQKAKLLQIHQDELDQERQLKMKERQDMLDVLTDDQRQQLQDLESKTKLERKAETEEHRAESEQQKAQENKAQAQGMGAATEPSNSNNP